MESLLFHPTRWRRTRPFADELIQALKACDGQPTPEDLERTATAIERSIGTGVPPDPDTAHAVQAEVALSMKAALWTASRRDLFIIDRSTSQAMAAEPIDEPFDRLRRDIHAFIAFNAPVGIETADRAFDGAYLRRLPAEGAPLEVMLTTRGGYASLDEPWLTFSDAAFCASVDLDGTERTLEAAVAAAARAPSFSPGGDSGNRFPAFDAVSAAGAPRSKVRTAADRAFRIAAKAAIALAAMAPDGAGEWPDDAPDALVRRAADKTAAMGQVPAIVNLLQEGFYRARHFTRPN